MAESTPLRIVMAPKTKRAVALGLAVESYNDYSAKDGDDDPGRWSDAPALHASNVVSIAKTFLAFLEDEPGD